MLPRDQGRVRLRRLPQNKGWQNFAAATAASAAKAILNAHPHTDKAQDGASGAPSRGEANIQVSGTITGDLRLQLTMGPSITYLGRGQG